MASKRHDITPRGQRKLSRRVSAEDVAGTLPSGPSTTRDLFDWPSDLVKQIFLDNVHGAGRELQFRSITQHGVHVYTDYSGMDCPREACRVLDQALQLHLPHYQETKFHFLRSCDFGVPQQAVLLAIARELDDNNTCVFSDINHRLPPADQAFLDAIHGIPQELGVPIQSGFSLVGFWGVHVCQLYRPGLSLSMQDVLLSSSCCLSSLILLLDMCVSLLLVLFPGRCP